MLRVNTLFKYVAYHPLEHQVVTTGTDRKIGFWETYDGSLIRELDGSMTNSVNAIDVSEDGVYVVSGGSDNFIKVSFTDLSGDSHFLLPKNFLRSLWIPCASSDCSKVALVRLAADACGALKYVFSFGTFFNSSLSAASFCFSRFLLSAPLRFSYRHRRDSYVTSAD